MKRVAKHRISSNTCLVSHVVLLVLLFIASSPACTQDFSNKGKEFWLCFPNHTPADGNLSKLALFITSDKASSGTITVNGFTVSFTVTANQISGPIDIPYSNAHLNTSNNDIPVNKGIHIKVANGQPPVVVYAHLYAGFRSAATLVLPVSTLGKKYFSTNFWQQGIDNSKSQFQVIAVEPNTTIRYQLRKDGILGTEVKFVNLPKAGDVVQIQDDKDLTGSIIESIASGMGGCKKIAVFSGSSAVAIGRDGCNGESFDPLFQQLYPVNTWGKNFGVLPFAISPNGYHVRVQAAEDDTHINIGSGGVTLNAGEFYPDINSGLTPFTKPVAISANKPISVSQYMMSAGCSGAVDQGDPDMVILNPVEQSIRDISLFSSGLQQITDRFLAVYIKTPAVTSFKINGSPPAGTFQPILPLNGYSYLVQNISSLTGSSLRLTADSGFNAIAYGLGKLESYAYSAGTNVKDLYQYISLQNKYASASFESGCSGTPFFLSMIFPYQPVEITWKFNGLFPDTTIKTPVYDSTWLVNGKQLFRYKLANPYQIDAPGVYPIQVMAQNPMQDGCSGEQEIEYEIKVLDRPNAVFTFTTSGCVKDKIHFQNASATNNYSVTDWHWDFGDGHISALKSTENLYNLPGSYNAKLYFITDAGCVSDTATKGIVLTGKPDVTFNIPESKCMDKPIIFTGLSGSASEPVATWYWSFGDGPAGTTTDNKEDQVHTYKDTGLYNVSLKAETISGCASSVITKMVDIKSLPEVDFNFTHACLPGEGLQFSNKSTISDGSQSSVTYEWNFGDNSRSEQSNPLHFYNTTGPYTVNLFARSKDGCADDTSIVVTTLFAKPSALFAASKEVCFGTDVHFTDKSSVPDGIIKNRNWIFGDGTSSDQQTPVKLFTMAGTYPVKLVVESGSGCRSDTAEQAITVYKLPEAAFKISGQACAEEPLKLIDLSSSQDDSITKWIWSFEDGTELVKSNNEVFSYTYNTAKAYFVKLKVETAAGCISVPSIKDVMVNPIPKADFIMPRNCLNDLFSIFTDRSAIADGTESGFTYLWGFDDVNDSRDNSSIEKNARHKYLATGKYNVSLTVTSKAGCSSTLRQPFTVNGGVPQSAFIVQGEKGMCSDKAITITNKSTVNFGEIVKLEIYWDYGNDPTNKLTDDFPVFNKDYQHQYPLLFTPAEKPYNVRVIAYSGESCLNTNQEIISVKAIPQIQSEANVSTCSNILNLRVSTPQLINNLDGEGKFGGKYITEAGLFNSFAAGIGAHPVHFSFLAMNGCSDTQNITVKVLQAPIANAGLDRTIREGESVTLNGSGRGNQLSYSWTPVLTIDKDTAPEPVVHPVDPITYQLTVSADNGCTASDEVYVNVLKKIKIPNVFSPNGDGINDKWEIAYLNTYPSATVDIYNRYGQLVTHYTGNSKPWDGYFNGSPIAAGTYYYVITIKDGLPPRTGYVDVIR